MQFSTSHGRSALEAAGRTGDELLSAQAHEEIGRALAALGDRPGALPHLREAVGGYETHGQHEAEGVRGAGPAQLK
ncbi:hypothetical protein ACIA8K_40315 [Catenuloplanes sp. NPDC051500]|uniref:hypothetical protein n=1 Tax=Catenuloplanes sp. NPDC051500 TaxID=3363959 RepID=UPI0037B66FF7